jgi:hypothetical protein
VLAVLTTAALGSSVFHSCGKVAQIGPQNGATSALRLDKTSLELIPVGVAYKEVLTVSGGFAPYKYALTFGELPSGLALNSATGELSGTVPLSEAGKKYQFKVTVTDSASITVENAYAVATAGYGFNIYPEELSGASPGFKFEMKLSTNGAVPPVTYTYKGQLPNGFELKNDTGIITTGSNTVAENLADTQWPIEIIATDANRVQGTREYNLKIENATPIPTLEITTTSLDDGVAGEAYHRVISATGGLSPYTFSIKGGLLFSGLSLNAQTGVISGTIPRTAINQVSTFIVKVVDTQGKTAEQPLSFKANPYAYFLTPEDLTPVIPEKPYDVKLTTLGASEPVTFAVTGNLPPNLAIDNGRLKTANGGVPISSQSTIWSFTITATDARGVTASRPYTLNVGAAVQPPALTMVTTSLSDPVAGAPYTAVISVTGGATPYTFSSADPLLPGLSLNTSTGVISGTVPAANVNLSRNFTITVTDGAGVTVSRPFSLRASAYSFVLGPEDFTSVIPEKPYSATLSAIGATAPVTYSITGSLPPNMRQNGNKIETLSGGVPITSKNTTWSFTISATDANGVQASRPYNLSVADALVTPTLTISTATLSDGVAGEKYTSVVSVTGGFTPYTFAIVTGSLPAGTTLDANTGVITGIIPRSELGKTFTFQVGVTDSIGGATSKSFTMRANTYTYVIAPEEIPAVTPETSFSFGFTGAGATAPITWSLTGSLPTGLTLNSSLGKIQSTGNGVPASLQNTSWPISLTATDNHGVSVTKSFTLAVGSAVIAPALQIATITIPTPTAGSLYAASIIATGGRTPYAFSISGGTLPQGLSIDSATGVISGTVPHNQTGAVYFFIVKVTDADNDDITQIYSGAISAYSISVVPSTLTNARPSLSYMNAFSAVGGQSPLTWALHSGTLPSGLSLSSDGLLSGIVAESEAGVTRTFSVRVTDGNGVVATRALTLATTAFPISISTTSLPTAQENSSYSSTLASSGGTGPYNYEYTGTLPAGMGMTNLGELFGTPVNGTGSLAGTPYTIQVRASDSAGLLTAWTPLTLTVGYSSPMVSTSSISNGIIGSTYTQFLAASGGKAPYSYSVKPGSSLPSGLSLASNGTLSGIPAVSTTCPASQFIVRATDLAGQVSADKTLCITVATGVNITTATIPSIVRNTLYQTSFSATGGVTPYTWSAFTLPSGLSINSSSGQISGLTSDNAGSGVAYITAQDVNGLSTTKAFNFTVAEPVTVDAATLPRAAAGKSYSFSSLTAQGGTAPYTFNLVSGSLPSGLSLSSSGVISGTVADSAINNTSYTFGVQATGSSGLVSVTRQFTINVTIPPKILDDKIPTGKINSGFSHPVLRTGGIGPFTWTASGLPAGLSIEAGRGTILGTPTESGSFNSVQLTITDTHGFSDTKTVSLEIGTSNKTIDFDTGRFTEPCPVNTSQQCRPYYYKVASLVPGNSQKYLVYYAELTSSAPLNSHVFYVARLNNQGFITMPANLTTPSDTPTTIYTNVGVRITDLEVADLDNDGILDIIYSDYANARIRVHFGTGLTDANGMPTFNAATNYALPGGSVYPKDITITNLRSTGAYKDIVVMSNWNFISNQWEQASRTNVFLSNCAAGDCSSSRATLFAAPTSYTPTSTNQGALFHHTNIDTGDFSSLHNCKDLVVGGTTHWGSGTGAWTTIMRQNVSGTTCLGTFNGGASTISRWYAGSWYPSSVAVADLNNNGIDDIAVTFSNASQVNIHFMSSEPTTIPVNTGVDFINAPLSYWGASIQKYCLNGTDTCTYPSLLVTGGRRAVYSDHGFNSRIAWPTSNGFLTVLPNSGSGTFFDHNTAANRIDYSFPNGMDSRPVLTSFIGSNTTYNDVLVMGLSNDNCCNLGVPYLYTVPANNGNTSHPFRAARMMKSTPDDFVANAAPGTLRIKDINKDGQPDIVGHLPDQAGVNISFGSASDNLLNAPSPNFFSTGAMNGFPFSWNQQQTLELDDINNDGFDDIITAGNTGRTVSVSLATGVDGQYGNPRMFNLGSGDTRPLAVSTGDLNNDSRKDIIVATGFYSATTQMNLIWLPGKGDGDFESPRFIAQGNGAINNCGDIRVVQAFDFDGDGKQEVITACYNGGGVYVYRQHTDGTWKMNTTTAGWNMSGGTNAVAMQLAHLTPNDACYAIGAEFSGQPCIDIVVANLDTANSIRIYNNVTIGKPNATGNFNLVATAANSVRLHGYVHDVVTADFDQDGLLDIAASMGTNNYRGGYAYEGGLNIYTLKGTGTATPPSLIQGWGAEGTLGRSLTAGDLNKDGRPDIIFGYGIGRAISPWRMISRFYNASY